MLRTGGGEGVWNSALTVAAKSDGNLGVVSSRLRMQDGSKTDRLTSGGGTSRRFASALRGQAAVLSYQDI
jgi:hypothetical protein